MVSSRQLLVSAICLLNIAQAIASSAFLQYLLCVDKANLNHILSSLSPPTLKIMTTGSTIRLVVKTLTKYAIGLCRGDVKLDVCHSCPNHSTDLPTQLCPNQKEAIARYEDCMLRTQTTTYLAPWKSLRAFCTWNKASADVDRLRPF
ncbi:putative cysteine-rich receptor-like protein kinase 9 [Alnus glutinosa]|uniref:putative cysteine-rich receptor-like protein kinase 9 n=1 Tax=Alnus glutinosa TaxID=3517 RepID=UPI002D78A12C|nr:putative cysteine-rich receptor-like protein kinase 9 [Alnus glutinosa]